MTTLITGAPLWVWPLFVVLLLAGLRARHTREVRVVLIYALPLLGLLALRSVSAVGGGVWVWAVFAIAYGAGALAGHQMQKHWTLARAGRKVRLAGETVTLLVMMVLFWVNFAVGVLQATAPAVVTRPEFLAALCILLGGCAGTFAGRALRIWRMG